MLSVRTAVTVSGLLLTALPLYAQTGARPISPASAPVATSASTPAAAGSPAGAAAPAGAVTPPPGYVIGPDDVLEVMFRDDEKSSSKDVPVRPDGKVSLNLLNELQAAGLTPEQFRAEVEKAATKFFPDPVVSVSIKQINSRRVYIMGSVNKPAAYMLGQPLTVTQLISLAGGLQEYANKKKIVITRISPDGSQKQFPFNFEDFNKGKDLQKNILLVPGDTVYVP